MKRTSPTTLAVALIFFTLATRTVTAQNSHTAPQWQEVELTFTASRDAANPYTDKDGWVVLTHDDGATLRRPMF